MVRLAGFAILVGLLACRDAAGPAAREPQPGSGPTRDRDLARTIDATVEVANVDRAEGRLRRVVARAGGFVQQGSLVRGDAPSAEVQALVPASALEALRTALGRIGTVEVFTEQVEDVTAARIDLDARLRNARAREERLRALTASATGNLQDVLAVEKELARVREEIERMQGEHAALAQRITFVLARVHLHPRSVAFFERPGQAIAEAAVEGSRAAWGLTVGIVVLGARVGPSMLVLGVLGAAALFAIRLILRRRRAAASAQA